MGREAGLGLVWRILELSRWDIREPGGAGREQLPGKASGSKTTHKGMRLHAPHKILMFIDFCS